MSSFRVNLSDDEPGEPANEDGSPRNAAALPVQPASKKRPIIIVLRIGMIAIGVVALMATVGGYLYWQSLKSTPQYSLALLVDAAKRNDQPTIDQLVDV